MTKHMAGDSHADLVRITEELRRREPIFHHPELGTTRADFERMIVEDFWEVGASGRRYDRDFVLAELEKRHSSAVEERWRIEDYECRALSEQVYLFTYVLWEEQRKTRRATIWTRANGDWKIIYHQGTLEIG